MTAEHAVLAGGCFWGMQDLIRKLPGVISASRWSSLKPADLVSPSVTRFQKS